MHFLCSEAYVCWERKGVERPPEFLGALHYLGEVPQKIPGQGQWSLPTMCKWENRDQWLGPIVVGSLPKKKGQGALAVPKGVFEVEELTREQVAVVVVNPFMKEVTKR